jgi:hypothetical protein
MTPVLQGPRPNLVLRPTLSVAASVVRRALRDTAELAVQASTAGTHPPRELDIQSENRKHAVEYVASPNRLFWFSVGGLPIDFRRFVFVDIGSGKGRMVFLATKLPFRRIEGVEFARNLHAAASRTLETLARSLPDPHRIMLHHKDAADYEIPSEPCVFYLFNPFERAVLDQFLLNVERSRRARPREIYIVYANPVHRSAFDGTSFRECRPGGWAANFSNRMAVVPFTVFWAGCNRSPSSGEID